MTVPLVAPAPRRSLVHRLLLEPTCLVLNHSFPTFVSARTLTCRRCLRTWRSLSV